MNNNEMDLYFFFDKETNILEITHTPTENKNGIELFHMNGSNMTEFESCAKIGLMCFNIGKYTQGHGTIEISPIIAITFLSDIENDSIIKLLKEIGMPNQIISNN